MQNIFFSTKQKWNKVFTPFARYKTLSTLNKNTATHGIISMSNWSKRLNCWKSEYFRNQISAWRKEIYFCCSEAEGICITGARLLILCCKKRYHYTVYGYIHYLPLLQTVSWTTRDDMNVHKTHTLIPHFVTYQPFYFFPFLIFAFGCSCCCSRELMSVLVVSSLLWSISCLCTDSSDVNLCWRLFFFLSANLKRTIHSLPL